MLPKQLVLHSTKTCTPQHCDLYSAAPKLVLHSTLGREIPKTPLNC